MNNSNKAELKFAKKESDNQPTQFRRSKTIQKIILVASSAIFWVINSALLSTRLEHGEGLSDSLASSGGRLNRFLQTSGGRNRSKSTTFGTIMLIIVIIFMIIPSLIIYFSVLYCFIRHEIEEHRARKKMFEPYDPSQLVNVPNFFTTHYKGEDGVPVAVYYPDQTGSSFQVLNQSISTFVNPVPRSEHFVDSGQSGWQEGYQEDIQRAQPFQVQSISPQQAAYTPQYWQNGVNFENHFAGYNQGFESNQGSALRNYEQYGGVVSNPGYFLDDQTEVGRNQGVSGLQQVEQDYLPHQGLQRRYRENFDEGRSQVHKNPDLNNNHQDQGDIYQESRAQAPYSSYQTNNLKLR